MAFTIRAVSAILGLNFTHRVLHWISLSPSGEGEDKGYFAESPSTQPSLGERVKTICPIFRSGQYVKFGQKICPISAVKLWESLFSFAFTSVSDWTKSC